MSGLLPAASEEDSKTFSIGGILALVVGGRPMSAAQSRTAFESVFAGQWGDVELAALLTALRARGETAEELFGAAAALRSMRTPIAPPIDGLLDTCGTGGDQAGTFNISTAVAIVVAGCGVPVAKHGNRAVSSRSGSADVLAELGCDIDADQRAVVQCLREIGLAFFFAPHWHAAMRHAGPVRRRLGFRTIFNLLGPLCNPAGASRQLIGVGSFGPGDRNGGRIVAEALRMLGTESAIVVQGADGLDEVSLATTTSALRIRDNAVVEEVWSPTDFGLPHWPLEAIRVDGPKESAAVIREVLAGKPGPHLDYVRANAAAALLAAGVVDTLAHGVERATEAIAEGKAAAALRRLARFHQADRTD